MADTPGYVPSLPHGIANPHVSETDAGGLPWTPAPPTSHLYRWRYYDVREHPFLAKFGPNPGKSQLHVTFRDKSGGPGPTYWYFFDSAEAGRQIVDKLTGSPHPHGEVLYPLVIKGGIPYTKAATG